MAMRYSSISLLLMSCLMTGTSQNQSRAPQPVRKVAITRTLTIPLTTQRAGSRASSGTAGRSTALTVSPGAADEQPEGPTGFDVFDDGDVLIADPLQKRLVLYDSKGAFQRSWEIGFAADSVRINSDGTVVVREETTGRLRTVDREGKSRAGGTTLPQLPKAQLQSGGRVGQIVIGPGQASGIRSFTVYYEQPGAALLSLESIAMDPDRGYFVALEASASGGGGGDAINVNKFVRRYSPQGNLLCETSSVPLDYYVMPVDELRVRKGVVYQLMTTRNEVQIHAWDTNER